MGRLPLGQALRVTIDRKRLTRNLGSLIGAQEKNHSRNIGDMYAIARFDIRHRKAIIAVSVLIFVVAGMGMTRLRVDSNFLNEFSPETPIRQSS